MFHLGKQVLKLWQRTANLAKQAKLDPASRSHIPCDAVATVRRSVAKAVFDTSATSVVSETLFMEPTRRNISER